jgi:hypothetical protein
VAEVLKVLRDAPLQVDVLIPEVAASPFAARWVKVKAQDGYSSYSSALADAAPDWPRAAQAFE